MSQPGSDGDPLPSGTLIFRVGRDVHASPAALQRREVVPGLFELTEADKASPGRRLSVWIEAMTIADQAWEIMGSKPKNTLVVCLNTDDIREIVPPEGFIAPDLEWEQALNPDETPNRRPGAEGHAGICNLHQGGNGKTHGEMRRRLRLKLAEIATLSPVPVPHDIPENHLRLAAFYIDRNGKMTGCSCEEHWIGAVRQLRRARAKEQSGQA